MLELWSGLLVFLSNAWVPLDNNLVERQLRDMVVGWAANITTAPSWQHM
jgi:transposase